MEKNRGGLQKIQGGGSQQFYYHDCSGRIPGHTTRAPPVGFELETNGFQFYAIANLDKTHEMEKNAKFLEKKIQLSREEIFSVAHKRANFHSADLGCSNQCSISAENKPKFTKHVSSQQ